MGPHAHPQGPGVPGQPHLHNDPFFNCQPFPSHYYNSFKIGKKWLLISPDTRSIYSLSVRCAEKFFCWKFLRTENRRKINATVNVERLTGDISHLSKKQEEKFGSFFLRWNKSRIRGTYIHARRDAPVKYDAMFRQLYVYPDPGHANAPNDLSPARHCPDLDNSDGGGYTYRIFPNAQHPGVVHAKSTRSFQVLHEFLTCTKVYFFTSYVIGIKASSGGGGGGGHVELLKRHGCLKDHTSIMAIGVTRPRGKRVIHLYGINHLSFSTSASLRSRDTPGYPEKSQSAATRCCGPLTRVYSFLSIHFPVEPLDDKLARDKPGCRVSEDKDAVIFSETSRLKDCYLPFS
ncbi:hypothetical protein ALC57_13776 [Trachymyrmex cornetzi]|uniref:Uncharacterized protein n=1 Tax=Trachymyrmex cornetzi TaxID=471704 RepID=A0A151IZ99_9HYME|nr:hypothetical protein ALC57_13776 [Trachymyrmex cornetzi]